MLGFLYDLIIVPLLIKLMVTLFPAFIITDIKSKIDRQQKLPQK